MTADFARFLTALAMTLTGIWTAFALALGWLLWAGIGISLTAALWLAYHYADIRAEREREARERCVAAVWARRERGPS